MNDSSADLKKCQKAWKKPAPRYTRGVLAKYAAHITSASLGAVTDSFVEVNEEGTEAAAATMLLVPKIGIEINPPKPFEMIVDRPFLFVIEDSSSKSILFMGIIFDPAQAD